MSVQARGGWRLQKGLHTCVRSPPMSGLPCPPPPTCMISARTEPPFQTRWFRSGRSGSFILKRAMPAVSPWEGEEGGSARGGPAASS